MFVQADLQLCLFVRRQGNMARKVRLTALQRDVLWLLEEAGEETFVTIQATLQPPDLETLDSAIAALTRLRYVRRADHGGATSVVLTTEGRRSLTI
jgi:hypothetical protein